MIALLRLWAVEGRRATGGVDEADPMSSRATRLTIFWIRVGNVKLEYHGLSTVPRRAPHVAPWWW